MATQAKELVEENNIDIDMIQCYEITNDTISFYTIHGKKLWPR